MLKVDTVVNHTREYGNVTANIVEITQLGEATIKFSQRMVLPKEEGGSDYNLSLINSNNTLIYVDVKPLRLFDESFDARDLNLTWNVTEFINDTMKIQLNFDYPLRVSPLIVPDDLVVFFNTSYKNLTNMPHKKLFLDADSRMLRKGIRK